MSRRRSRKLAPPRPPMSDERYAELVDVTSYTWDVGEWSRRVIIECLAEIARLRAEGMSKP